MPLKTVMSCSTVPRTGPNRVGAIVETCFAQVVCVVAKHPTVKINSVIQLLRARSNSDIAYSNLWCARMQAQDGCRCTQRGDNRHQNRCATLPTPENDA